MSKEAMKLALEALETIAGAMPFPVGKSAITALRQALEQPAQKCSYPYCGCNSKAWCKVERNEALDKKAENARELGLDYEPAQQEPVACQYAKDVAMPEYRCVGRCQYDTSPPEQQEPVAYLCENAVGHKYFRWKKPSSTYKPTALYTSPPAQRTWVDLTDDEIKKEFHPLHATGLQFARAVLAKSKEKNT